MSETMIRSIRALVNLDGRVDDFFVNG